MIAGISRIPNVAIAATWLILANSQTLTQAQSQLLIRAQHIYSADGKWGEPGEILVRDGKIARVGQTLGVELPAELVVEVDSIMPGLVNAYSAAGLSGGEGEVSREVTPEFDTHSAIDFLDRQFAEALDQGVTTLQVVPGTDSVFAGQACVVKTAGPISTRTIEPASALVIAMNSDPTSRNRSRSRPDSIYVRQPTNRMGVVWIVRSTLHRLKNGEPISELDPSAAPLLSNMLAGKVPVASVSRTDFDIRASLDLGDEFGFDPIIYGGDEVYRILDEFKERGGRIVYTALATSTSSLRGSEGTALRWNVPGKLLESGTEFCLAGNALLDQARFAVRFGLEPQVALEAITIRPAKMIGQADHIGSLTEGKHADLVGLSGDPLKPTSAVTWTMVNGTIYGNDKSKQ